MVESKRLDSLLRKVRPFLAVFLAAGLMVFTLLAVLAESSRAQDADSLPADASTPQAHGRQTAVREGIYPAQLAGSTGAIQPSRFGPQRNDPAEGIPEHAYSPFDERNNREHPCPPGGCDFVPGSVVIKFEPDVKVNASQNGRLTREETVNKTLADQGIKALQPVFPGASPPAPGTMVRSPAGELVPLPDLTRWYQAELDEKEADVYTAVDELSSDPGIAWAEPDYLRRASGETAGSYAAPLDTAVLPGSGTDPLYDQQWHLGAANVPQAWAHLEGQGLPPGGSSDIVVAVIDSGIDYAHPDLAANMWVNAQEFSGSPGVDDDGNGFVDDIHGVNVVGTHSGDPMDDHGHGTHVAGIIGAGAHNGLGGVGVAYNVKLMGIKAAQYSGVLAATDIAEGLYYAVENGADIINMSFGGYVRSQVEEDALAVAFGHAVLVGAAGNDSKINLPCPGGRDFYPAAYNWVLGVMASDNSGSRTGFSNFDCRPKDTHEYELLAPGVDVMSTLPPTSYAAWDGTSMAAPVVSGIAALARTQWSDKDVYFSRFIMGQIAANATPVADGYAALATTPQPELSYLEHWVFDTELQAEGNDTDGIVDAGETVDLAIVIRNHWGKADPVTVTLEAMAEGAVFPDPYVTMITGTVSYGAVGSFNQDDNGLIYDAEGVITGVQDPFRFSVDAAAPNDHVIPFLLTMAAENGYDPTDPDAPYISQSRFYLIVQNGLILPNVISADMTLSNDQLWIVDGPTVIESGVSVTITEGTQVMWGIEPQDPYSLPQSPYLQVEGQLFVSGSYEFPVELFPNDNFVDPIVGNNAQASARILNYGASYLRYCRISRPELGRRSFSYGVDTIEHCELTGDGVNAYTLDRNRGLIIVAKQAIEKSIIVAKYLAYTTTKYPFGHGSQLYTPVINMSLVDSVRNVSMILRHSFR